MACDGMIDSQEVRVATAAVESLGLLLKAGFFEADCDAGHIQAHANGDGCVGAWVRVCSFPSLLPPTYTFIP